MEWIFLLIAYLPIVGILAGIPLLAAGSVLRKTNKQVSKGLFTAGGICVGVFVLICGALFLAGALGLGPVPN